MSAVLLHVRFTYDWIADGLLWREATEYPTPTQVVVSGPDATGTPTSRSPNP